MNKKAKKWANVILARYSDNLVLGRTCIYCERKLDVSTNHSNDCPVPLAMALVESEKKLMGTDVDVITNLLRQKYEAISKQRDEINDIMTKYEEILESSERGLYALHEAIDAFSELC